MPYDANVLRRASQRLEAERRERREAAEARRREAYARQPRLEQLDRQLRQTMAQLGAAALRRGEDPVQAVRRVREHRLPLPAGKERRGLRWKPFARF